MCVTTATPKLYRQMFIFIRFGITDHESIDILYAYNELFTNRMMMSEAAMIISRQQELTIYGCKRRAISNNR